MSDSLKAQQRIAEFITVRDTLKKMDEDHKAKCKPLRELQEMLSGWLMQFLDRLGEGKNSIATEAGTAYTSTRYTTSLADPDLFMKYVIDNELFDLLDRGANPTAVKEYVQTHKSLPPGCNLNAITTVGVRKGKGKTEE